MIDIGLEGKIDSLPLSAEGYCVGMQSSCKKLLRTLAPSLEHIVSHAVVPSLNDVTN